MISRAWIQGSQYARAKISKYIYAHRTRRSQNWCPQWRANCLQISPPSLSLWKKPYLWNTSVLSHASFLNEKWIKIRSGNFFRGKIYVCRKKQGLESFHFKRKYFFDPSVLTVSFSTNFERGWLVFIVHVCEADVGGDNIEILILLLWNLGHCSHTNI